jgi:hypothetical protein
VADFRSRIIRPAYLELLGREGDEGGVNHYNDLMNGRPPRTPETKMTEAELRESLIRSEEFASSNPEGGGGPPPLPPGTMKPLRVQGNQFRVEGGTGSVKLMGMVVAGDFPGTPDVDEGLALGWPLLTRAAIDMIADHGLNYSVFRLGPSVGKDLFEGGEKPEFVGYRKAGNKYDLDRWNEDFWTLVREGLAYARTRGVYICCSVIDSWLLDHILTPWEPERNLQGYSGGSLAVVRQAPTSVHEKWIRKLVRSTGEFENVLYLDGNESFKGRPAQAWVHGIRDIVKDELRQMGVSDRLFSTNSGITEEVDFLVLHDQGIPEPNPNRPIVVDEYPTRPVSSILQDANTGFDGGGKVNYIYWRGDHSMQETDEVLRGLQRIVQGGDPDAPPAFPTLTKMGIVTHAWLTAAHQQVDGPTVNGFHNIDLTPKFGNPPKPCNEEHNERCGGFVAEDPRGGVWELVEAPPGTRTKVENGGFLFKVGPMQPGRYRVRCSPWPDSRDPFGRPHRVAPDAARELEWVL